MLQHNTAVEHYLPVHNATLAAIHVSQRPRCRRVDAWQAAKPEAKLAVTEGFGLDRKERQIHSLRGTQRSEHSPAAYEGERRLMSAPATVSGGRPSTTQSSRRWSASNYLRQRSPPGSAVAPHRAAPLAPARRAARARTAAARGARGMKRPTRKPNSTAGKKPTHRRRGRPWRQRETAGWLRGLARFVTPCPEVDPEVKHDARPPHRRRPIRPLDKRRRQSALPRIASQSRRRRTQALAG